MQCDNFGYLIHHLSAALEHQSELVLNKKVKIGFAQFKILMALKWCSGVRQRQIATYLGQTEASISRQIKLMVEQGLLDSKPNPTNRRDHITTLTTKGEHTAIKAMEVLDDHFDSVLATLSATRQAQLLQLLTVVHKGVCKSSGGQCSYPNI